MTKLMQKKCCNCGSIFFGSSDFCSDTCSDDFSDYIEISSDKQNVKKATSVVFSNKHLTATLMPLCVLLGMHSHFSGIPFNTLTKAALNNSVQFSVSVATAIVEGITPASDKLDTLKFDQVERNVNHGQSVLDDVYSVLANNQNANK